MSAKAVKQPASAAKSGPATSGMPAGLVDSLQSEVAAEASPLMSFLLAHSAKIALCLVLFIVAIGGYWFYSWKSEGARREEAAELGKILVISDPSIRMERLQNFIGSAPDSVKRSAWFSMLETASLLEDNQKLYDAWKAISEMDRNIKVPATLGMANALTAQDKYAEALTLLDSISSDLRQVEATEVNIRIALLAELQSDYTRALKACDAVTSDPLLDPAEARLWGQKKDDLAAKAAKNKEAGAESGS